MFANIGSGDRGFTLTIWPPNAPSAQRFIRAFRAGNPLDEDDARQVQQAAQYEAREVGYTGGPKEWNPRWPRWAR